jgi:hypothetical protein
MAALGTGSGEPATAGFDFTGDPAASQVSLQADEKLRVIVRSDPEWWWVRKASGGEGYVPHNYVTIDVAAGGSDGGGGGADELAQGVGEMGFGGGSGPAEEAEAEIEAEIDIRASTFQASSVASNNVEDLLAKDNEDESLAKYKASLLGAAAEGDR